MPNTRSHLQNFVRQCQDLAKLQPVRLLLSLLILIGSMIYVSYKLPAGWAPLLKEIATPYNMELIVAGSIAVAISNVLLVLGWYWVMASVSQSKLEFTDVWQEYSASYFLRYLGGYWGSVGFRHFQMSRKYSLSHGNLLSVAIWEVLLLILCSVLLSLGSLDVFVEKIFSTATLPSEILSIALVVAVMLFVLWNIGRRVQNFSLLGFAFLSYLLFVGFQSLIFALICTDSTASLSLKFATHNIGWIVGQLTPGAIQGLGVREAVTASLLSDVEIDSHTMLWVVTFRVITIGGDALFFLLSRRFGWRKRSLKVPVTFT